MRLARARIAGDALVDVDVAGGRIAALSPTGTTRPAGDVLDLAGRRLIPGLWDEHVHVRTWAVSTRRIDVRSAAGPEEVAALVRAALPTAEPGLPVVAAGMRDGLWGGAPSRRLLDEIAPDAPVMVISSDLHSSWSNAALGRLLGIELDETGMLREAASFAAATRVESLVADRADAWVLEALGGLGRRGVVGLVDLDFDDAVGAWERRPTPPVRIDAGVYPQHLEAAEARGAGTGAPINGLARVGPLKVITDGSLGTRTAYCHAPYPGTTDRGVLEVAPERLVGLLRRGAALGLTPAIHAIGDAANALALDAFAEAGVRGRIEHAQLLSEADLARMAALGIRASIQPEHMLDDRGLVARFWGDRAGDAFRVGSLVAAGVDVVFGSDAPVTPLDPWFAISAAVTRSRDGDPPWQPWEAVDVETALRLSARSRIAVGEPADLVALGADPTPERLRTMPVDLTLVAGGITHTEL
ncbi:amidohydrolase [Tsukamurella ocularis]|uniref:amidohydrolase n=1 Tax=Tsukamurella ocularis TaxID=1970234 RepID=UPI0021672957|nr:amidohydrolase family protein [Tsukamurella ocularis]MCS3781029.1 putative amidohydrolase YtcJ [Tsukamurella ocularis]MCS3786853.1 putative amidohydrolase YtcJ [Tsukamurella ocularis]MCS3850695.1 putative amidohydrolase YtcJ [Tsukamurella ocularis]